jgi:hypothetical protein
LELLAHESLPGGFNDSHLSTVNLQGSSGFTLLNLIASVTRYILGNRQPQHGSKQQR